MNIFIVRHGETEWNRIGLVQGRADNPLNENGILACKQLQTLFDQKEFQALIMSPLRRTIHTGLILTENAIVEDYRLDPRIIEKDFGISDGKPIEERHLNYPNGHAPGEESYKLVRKRMITAFKSYVKRYDKDILVISHGAAIAALMKEVSPEFDRTFVRLKNNSLTVLDGKTLEVKAFDLIGDEAAQWMKDNYK
ncbi:histidine phosphatase family protein [Faecalicoccus pleomorphus]|uniref:Histidine phosphatase family protein n=1 Tax=Faecalicoccus pleomorphus TaxID=1323 RepID=A0AAW6CV76_9FIRM|nr:histidine phosphatase family protein [Faecalicoccus pleomorphus]MDB7980649.1 histidine phosphatase family protein [Faecalicoccus pleomorphus]MDB7982856.1 histidine phosphatase family protein [Faecalicoccus pleomorphus]MDB7984229.1 histidine phosphatase family protein [Faecalicoccus pleomorphus]